MISDESAVVGDPHVLITGSSAAAKTADARVNTAAQNDGPRRPGGRDLRRRPGPAPITYLATPIAGDFTGGISIWSGWGNDGSPSTPPTTAPACGPSRRWTRASATTPSTSASSAQKDGFFVLNTQGPYNNQLNSPRPRRPLTLSSGDHRVPADAVTVLVAGVELDPSAVHRQHAPTTPSAWSPSFDSRRRRAGRDPGPPHDRRALHPARTPSQRGRPHVPGRGRWRDGDRRRRVDRRGDRLRARHRRQHDPLPPRTRARRRRGRDDPGPRPDRRAASRSAIDLLRQRHRGRLRVHPAAADFRRPGRRLDQGRSGGRRDPRRPRPVEYADATGRVVGLFGNGGPGDVVSPRSCRRRGPHGRRHRSAATTSIVAVAATTCSSAAATTRQLARD